MRIVLDTNILVAAIRSRSGAAFELLSSVGTGRFDIVVSVPLVLEYEDALLRHRQVAGLSVTDVRDLIDYLCRVGIHQRIFFLWRPMLRDPNDDMVAEVAVAASCTSIVTHNVADFFGVDKFGIAAVPPAKFLQRLRRLK